MREWWQGTRLVAGRSLAEQFRSRSFKVVTGLLLLVSAAAVIVPQVLGDDDTTYTLATVGETPDQLAAMLKSAQEAGEFTVEFETHADRAEVRDSVEEGDATAGLVDDTLYTSSQVDGTFPVLVAQAVVALETSSRLAEAGLSPEQVARVQDVRPPEQVPVSQVDDEGRAGVGFAVGVVLYIALTFAGSTIATTVAMEKSTRISEVLLAVLRPSQAMVGTVLAVGTVTLTQLLILAVPLAVAVRLTDAVGLPGVATGDLALAIMWFVLGFALYAFLFAASAAMVDKITEASSAILPVMTILIVAYMLSVTMVTADPGSVVSVVASIFPLTAPVSMPIRWATGDVPVYQLVAAIVLTTLTSALLATAAAAIYSRALLITGRRARWREVLR